METFEDRKEKTGMETSVNSEVICLSGAASWRWGSGRGGSCFGAKQELGSSPHSCLLGRLDSISLYSFSMAKDFHLQLSEFSYLPIRGKILLVLGIWGLENKKCFGKCAGTWVPCNWWVPSSIVVQRTEKMWQGILTLPQGRRLLNALQRWVFHPLWLCKTSGLALTSGHNFSTLALFLIHCVLC